VDAVPDPTLVCNADGIVEWSNTAALLACQFCDARAGRPLRFRDGVRDADAAHLTGAALLADLSARLVQAGQSVQRLLAREPDARSTLYAELHARPLLGAVGVSRGMILRLQDVTERELERRRLTSEVSRFDQLAHHDALTGLANRRLFQRRLDEALAGLRDSDNVTAVLFLDLDGFKRINDSLGHEVGDLVLRTIATRLRSGVRQTDTVARFGGDEFAVILRDCGNIGVVRRIGNELLASVAAPLPRNMSRLDVGASIGIALAPEHAATASELLRLADAAMYQAKTSGKGRLCVHGE
jgi:diguanylate cyclase (GGDEF)-like protein